MCVLSFGFSSCVSWKLLWEAFVFTGERRVSFIRLMVVDVIVLEIFRCSLFEFIL